jgi:hypothetical protein
MTNNKNYQVKILCGLRNIDVESEEAQQFYKWSILDLLNAIREAREEKKPKVVCEQEEEEDLSFVSRAGCRY